jgi:hypothetical protein
VQQGNQTAEPLTKDLLPTTKTAKKVSAVNTCLEETSHVTSENIEPKEITQILHGVRGSKVQEQSSVLAVHTTEETALQQGNQTAEPLTKDLQPTKRMAKKVSAVNTFLEETSHVSSENIEPKGITQMIHGVKGSKVQEQSSVLAVHTTEETALQQGNQTAEPLTKDLHPTKKTANKLSAVNTCLEETSHVSSENIEPKEITQMIHGVKGSKVQEQSSVLAVHTTEETALQQGNQTAEPLTKDLLPTKKTAKKVSAVNTCHEETSHVSSENIEPKEITQMLHGVKGSKVQEQSSVLAVHSTEETALQQGNQTAEPLTKDLQPTKKMAKKLSAVNTCLEETSHVSFENIEPKEITQMLHEVKGSKVQEQSSVLAVHTTEETALQQGNQTAEPLAKDQQPTKKKAKIARTPKKKESISSLTIESDITQSEKCVDAVMEPYSLKNEGIITDTAIQDSTLVGGAIGVDFSKLLDSASLIPESQIPIIATAQALPNQSSLKSTSQTSQTTCLDSLSETVNSDQVTPQTAKTDHRELHSITKDGILVLETETPKYPMGFEPYVSGKQIQSPQETSQVHDIVPVDITVPTTAHPKLTKPTGSIQEAMAVHGSLTPHSEDQLLHYEKQTSIAGKHITLQIGDNYQIPIETGTVLELQSTKEVDTAHDVMPTKFTSHIVPSQSDLSQNQDYPVEETLLLRQKKSSSSKASITEVQSTDCPYSPDISTIIIDQMPKNLLPTTKSNKTDELKYFGEQKPKHTKSTEKVEIDALRHFTAYLSIN